MRITLGVTDNAWAGFLRDRYAVREANFWVPSGRSFMGRASLGEPFLFKTKRPVDRLVGGGFYTGFYELRVSEAWRELGPGNGCADEATLSAAIQVYRRRNKAPYEPDPTIGCLTLRNLFFAPDGDDLPPPPHWGGSIVQGKTYDDRDVDWSYVEHAFTVLQTNARVDFGWDRDLQGVDLDVRRFGAPVLTQPRLGQATFRLAVLGAYGSRCAITSSSATPALEAAHIQPYAAGGAHRISNGLALRSDLHRLYDRGYVGIDPDHRLRVSPRLRDDFGNGVDLYEREARGEVVRLPTRVEDAPDRDALAWHMETVFRSA